MTTLYQQGDILVVKVDELPDGTTEKLDHGVLAEGEMTGHAHRLDADLVAQGIVQLLKINGELYMRALKEVQVTHEEHNPVTIPPGDYKVEGVREYDHFAEEARRVAD